MQHETDIRLISCALNVPGLSRALVRCAVATVCFATSAQAWEFTPGLPCILTHDTDDAEIELTYDPTKPLYSVTIRQANPWPASDIFALQFDGPSGMTISTDRHALNRDGRAVTVFDTGFGNVLNGLQFNTTVTAYLGDTTVSFPLAGAAGPVADFRLCRAQPGA